MFKIQNSKLIILFLLACTMVAHAQQQVPQVPIDPAIRYGQLDNGLTYYLQHNNWPEQRAYFYIAQRVGSIQEEESQRGLAHFLEHMAFNGSNHFPGDQLIKWCQSKGVAFGRELNAFTSTDCTVYNIDNVSTELGQAVLDSFLLILYDWADGLQLADAEIDNERGVIHEEWRVRSSAMQRIYNRQLPVLYPGSRYGERMPIGLMSVVDNFKYKELRDYYEKWYNPENQAIIVVGDIDVDHFEAQIKQLFGAIKPSDNAGKVVPEPVPDNADPIIIVDKDKELSSDMLWLCLKHDNLTDDLRGTVLDALNNYLNEAQEYMFCERLKELTLQPDCPFAGAEGGESNRFLLATTKGAFMVAARPKSTEQTDATLAAVIAEIRRAAQYGFTAAEYERFKADLQAKLKNALDNKDKRSSRTLARAYYNHYLTKHPIPSVDDNNALQQQFMLMLPLEQINQYTSRNMAQLDSNLVICSFHPEKDGAVYPTNESLTAALQQGKQTPIEAYKEETNDKPLLARLPKTAKVKKQSQLAQPEQLAGTDRLQLKNGITVLLKPTDYKADEVLLYGFAPVGSGRYPIADFANIQLYSDILDASGLGGFSNSDLRKLLAGKTVSLSLSLSDVFSEVNGSCAPADLETMLQLLYLTFTDITKDEQSYQSIISMLSSQLKNAQSIPNYAMNDSLQMALSNHNPRKRNLSINDLNHLSYDRILQMAHEQTMGGQYTFVIVGNYSPSDLQLIINYLSALPKCKKALKPVNTTTYATEPVVNHFQRKLETNQVTSYLVLSNSTKPYTIQNEANIRVLGNLLQNAYTKTIREERGIAYSPAAVGRASIEGDTHVFRLLGLCNMDPDKADTGLYLMRNEMEKLQYHCDPELVRNTVANLIKNFDSDLRANKTWVNAYRSWVKYGINPMDYRRCLEAITPESLQLFMRDLLSTGNLIDVTMYPEE